LPLAVLMPPAASNTAAVTKHDDRAFAGRLARAKLAWRTYWITLVGTGKR
jgi:hypothetical protein